MKKGARLWLARFLVAILATVAALKVGDLTVGICCQSYQRHLLRLPANSRSRHVSTEFDCSFTTNSHGLRGPQRPFAKPAGTQRVAVVGDSFVAGYEVSDESTFTAKLETLLNAGSKFPSEVINVGRGGSSTIRELDLYTLVGRRFAPDVVVLAYFLGNDLHEVVDEHDREQLREWRPRGTVRGAAYALCPNLYRELALLRLSSESRASWQSRSEEELLAVLRSECEIRGADAVAAARAYRELPDEIRSGLEQGRLHNHRVLPVCYDSGRLIRTLDPDDTYFERAWPRTERHLELLRQATQADGAKLALMLIPDGVQVDAEAFEFASQLGYKMDAAWKTRSCRTADAVAAWCRESKVPCLDLLEDFRATPEQLYFPQDGHFNEAGHARAAELLAEFLKTPLARE